MNRFALVFALPFLSLGLGAGCTPASTGAPPVVSQNQGSDILQKGEPFVPLTRTIDGAAATTAATMARRVHADSVPAPTAPTAFYLAIKKSELGQKWFLSAYLKDYFPDAIAAGAASSLGVRVVTFRLQNDKLYVFDASNNYKDSDTFDPELILEAYPVVSDFSSFLGLPGSDDYILVDPAAGLNKMSLFLGDTLATYNGVHFEVDAAYMQNFRKISDGYTYEQVFSGFSDDFPTQYAAIAPNPYRGQGTLGFALRRYSEGSGYSAKSPALSDLEYFFRSDNHLVPNTGLTTSTWMRWNFHKGMKPITWLIDPQTTTAFKNKPDYAGYDLFAAFKRGIESWNDVFGYPVFQAKLADPGVSYADDDNNYIIFDQDPTYGYAFANWRANPNTGEVRGASVYFNESWVDSLIYDYSLGYEPAGTFTTGAKPQLPAPSQTKKAPLVRFGWSSMTPSPLCVLSVDDMKSHVLKAAPPRAADGTFPQVLADKTLVEAALAHVIAHEVGHTLGLRHNFKGSLVEPYTSSIMDYTENTITAATPGPQAYDVAAIHYLYDIPDATGAVTAPTQLFCTDEATTYDPMCATFDSGADPLNQIYAPLYQEYMQYSLSGWFPATLLEAYYPDLWNEVMKFVRAGTYDQQVQALDILRAPFALNAPQPSPAAFDYSAELNELDRFWWKQLFQSDPSARGAISNDVVLSGALATTMIGELAQNLENRDGQREWATRRLAVDVLKKLQTADALDALTKAKSAITTEAATLTGTDAEQAQDLLVRLNNALSPYFIN